jgi:type II secretory pathway component PulK
MNQQRDFSRPRQRSSREGFVLILVLVLVSAMALAVYTFSGVAVENLIAGTSGLQQTRRRHLAESAIEFAAVRLAKSQSEMIDQVEEISFPDGTNGRFLLLQQQPTGSFRPPGGLMDECGRLNLNSLSLRLSRRRQSRNRLLALPGMTPVIADSILDWMDDDDEESEFGAESSWYLTRTPPRYPANGPIRDLSELLHVRGMTPELLWGEDANGNGVLDPREDDGNRSLPRDNADGRLDAGFSQWLTLSSAESELRSDGQQGVWLNSDDPAAMYDAVLSKFGSETALYILAARLNGIRWSDQAAVSPAMAAEMRRLERLEEVQERLRAQLGLDQRKQPRFQPTMRGGVSINSPGIYRFRSLLDLFGGTVRVLLEGKDRVLKSPWAADAGTIERMLPELQEFFRIGEEPVAVGRVNINSAPLPVLMSVPGISRSLATAILRGQPQPGEPIPADQSSVSWLLRRGLVSPSELRQMAPFITTRGDVYRGVAVGLIEGERSAAMIQFVLDVTGFQHRLVSFQDLQPESAVRLKLPWQRRRGQ